MSSYDLGPLGGNTWHQYANSAGQVYYQNIASGTVQYRIPAGWEDQAQDTWNVDNSRGWPQWRNHRTGRVVLTDPNPPPPQTYLDVRAVRTHLATVERTPASPEFLYRRAMNAILRWLFPEQEGFDVVQEEGRDSRPDFVVFKICCRPGGSDYSYDFCVVESKTMGQPWGSTEDQCANQCDSVENESRKIYAIVHIGMHIAFYQYDNGTFSQISGRLHLRNDVHQVMDLALYMKENPLPIVRI